MLSKLPFKKQKKLNVIVKVKLRIEIIKKEKLCVCLCVFDFRKLYLRRTSNQQQLSLKQKYETT